MLGHPQGQTDPDPAGQDKATLDLSWLISEKNNTRNKRISVLWPFSVPTTTALPRLSLVCVARPTQAALKSSGQCLPTLAALWFPAAPVLRFCRSNARQLPPRRTVSAFWWLFSLSSESSNQLSMQPRTVAKRAEDPTTEPCEIIMCSFDPNSAAWSSVGHRPLESPVCLPTLVLQQRGADETRRRQEGRGWWKR